MVTTPNKRGKAVLAPQRPANLGAALTVIHNALDAAALHYGHGTDSAWDEAVQLVLCACDLAPDAGDEVLDRPVDEAQWQRMRQWLEARIEKRVPLPYLTGRAWFAGLPFHCDARALVPRSPLAELIVGDYAPWWSGPAPATILDLCCGGGAIGIAAAIYAPNAQVVLSDVDTQALALARQNCGFHAVEDRVAIVQSDLFGSLQGRRFDLILSNPPYVDAADLAAMPAEYHAEPPIGLGSGDDGLNLARRILSGAAAHLSSEGMLFLEVGNSWEALDRLLETQPLTWLEFSEGGHGVLAVHARELAPIAALLAGD